MTKEQMLTAIINKPKGDNVRKNKTFIVLEQRYLKEKPSSTFVGWLLDTGFYKLLLIDHDFCKALWGGYPMCHTHKIKMIESEYKTGWLCPKCKKNLYMKYESHSGMSDYEITWQYHLQQAIISDNMLQYVYDSIKET